VGAYFYSPPSKQASKQSSRQASYKSAVVRQSAFSYLTFGHASKTHTACSHILFTPEALIIALQP